MIPAPSPTSAQAPRVRRTDHLARKSRRAAKAATASESGLRLSRCGTWRSTGPQVKRADLAEQRVDGEVDRQVRDHPDHGCHDPRQGRRQRVVAAESLHVGGAHEDEHEARHEGHPGGQERCHDGGDPWVEGPWVVVGADEGHELDHHDQRPGGRLRQGESGDHLAGGEPAVDLHRLLGNVGKNRVGTSEGDQRSAGEEQRLVGEDAVPPCRPRPQPLREQPTRRDRRR